jgi:hypothetical protein
VVEDFEDWGHFGALRARVGEGKVPKVVGPSCWLIIDLLEKMTKGFRIIIGMKKKACRFSLLKIDFNYEGVDDK